MKRLLCIIGSMNVGGAETFLMKIYRKLDKSLYQIDFAIATNNKSYYYDEITSLGGIIYCITPKSKNILRNMLDIWHLVKEHNYKHILRVSQHSLSGLELLIARLAGAEICAFRSSNSNTTTGDLRGKISHYIFRFLPKFIANVKIAPSPEAAIFMFGKRALYNKKVNILSNAIDLNEYKFDADWRRFFRTEFDVEDCFVIGHIGRFNCQKNHSFLLDIFYEISHLRPNSILMLVGKGELEDNIRKKAIKLGIIGKIIFTGIRSDIPKLLCSMDVMVFPSFYEGMPNTIIEAQATGLPCYISDTISKDVNITGLVHFLSLSSSAEKWADQITQLDISDRVINVKDYFKKQSYEIESSVSKFIKLIFED